ncbi:MAG TPA: 30S ribosomal protein S6 [Thermoanaerobaculia bacterium]|nr:30S ribosomal protein S6 [Thermoanaerobaculia bacterium]HPA52814.1 30S ribosomal protein S6 [Thermoanaerobaculia bacterium]HQN07221.1 30S ribosomal protein S6 [Thermoanaerobaculia bacterium]HQP85837.1 30S ribosomal protein S6 [Thermoanaerobaculia bacterium]
MTETQKRLYDLVFLIAPDKDEQGAAAVVEEFRKLLTDLGAVIEKDESMGRRRLAYQIKKRGEATYHNFLFRADAKAVAELQRKMKLSESILRFLTVRIDEELRHGQKVARRTKTRTPRVVPASPESVPAPEAVAAPAPAPAPVVEPASAPAPAPESAAPEAPAQPES